MVTVIFGGIGAIAQLRQILFVAAVIVGTQRILSIEGNLYLGSSFA
jgi:hypothetical protein